MFVSNGNVLDEQDVSPKGNGNDRDNTVSRGIDTFNRHSDTACLVCKVNLTVFLMFGPISHPPSRSLGSHSYTHHNNKDAEEHLTNQYILIG